MKLTKCWSCRNAVPGPDAGCPWSRSFTPVEGWKARKTKIKFRDSESQKNYDCDSFFVTKCPLYERDCADKDLIIPDSFYLNYETKEKLPTLSMRFVNLDTGEEFITPRAVGKYITTRGLTKSSSAFVGDRMSRRGREKNEFFSYGIHWFAEQIEYSAAGRRKRPIRSLDTGVVYETVRDASEWIAKETYRNIDTVAAYMSKVHGTFSVYGYRFEDIGSKHDTDGKE